MSEQVFYYSTKESGPWYDTQRKREHRWKREYDPNFPDTFLGEPILLAYPEHMRYKAHDCNAEAGSKPSVENPKYAAGEAKANMMVSFEPTAIYDSLSYHEGLLKYGQGNYSEVGTSVQTYLKACMRHLEKFSGGQWADPQTEVPHLISARRCLAIIFDGFIRKVITDDRPAPWDVEAVEADVARIQNKLNTLFADRTPQHFDRRNSRHKFPDPTTPPHLLPGERIREIDTTNAIAEVSQLVEQVLSEDQ